MIHKAIPFEDNAMHCNGISVQWNTIQYITKLFLVAKMVSNTDQVRLVVLGLSCVGKSGELVFAVFYIDVAYSVHFVHCQGPSCGYYY